MRKAEISDCELVAMKCVWDAGEPVPCSYVIEKLKTDYGRDYAETTVYTFLKNLKNKGFVESFKKGITFFQPKRELTEFRGNYIKKMVDFWFDGSIADFLAAFLEVQKLDEKEVKEVKKVLKNANQ
ncbi:MAG: BlaI/MecI/CopY family transcriptional regulator [Lachnospiraceae bacterium]|nr:BlaI/MecI/CopY family transcriptional regulator [Lachnospiraceae bacterium]